MIKKLVYSITLLLFSFILFAQTALGSIEEQYYDFLSLKGEIERPYLGYRSIITSEWNTSNIETSILKNDFTKKEFILKTDTNSSTFFSKGIDSSIRFTILNLDFYNSYNTASPYGFNDESLWQGKGYNTSLTSGIMGNIYGFKFVLNPRINFSQNLPFEYMKPNYSGDTYKKKAEDYGDYGLPSIDAPQRFGDKPFTSISLNDTYIGYQFYNFILGFGNTNIILGPAYLNPLIHSNNAQTYPKIDFGLNKSEINLFNHNFGNLEFHYWVGKLKESEYFDNIETNNDRLISAFNVSFEPKLLEGLTLGFSRTMLSKFNNRTPYTLFKVFVPLMEKSAGYDESDQRASIYFDYLIPSGGVDVYFEWAKNDYNNNMDNLIRYPFHTQAITAGMKKSLKFSEALSGLLITEISYLGSSMDYVFFYDWGGIGNSFYTHHKITQGYTNNGQLIGAPLGSGGNSQHLELKLFSHNNIISIFLNRNNPDLNYSYFQDKEDPESEEPKADKKKRIRANLSIGISDTLFIKDNLLSNFGLIFTDEHNPLNINNLKNGDSTHRYNFTFICEISYLIK